MNKKHRTLLLVAVLLLAVVILSGCSVPQGTININAAVSEVGWWNGFIVYPLAKLLMKLNEFIRGLGVVYSWGWAIIVFTILVKVVTLPLTFKQLQSTKAQQALQPKMRELQEKYGKDKQKLAEEQMKMYKEYGVSPMGGCLPLIIQLPILWGLYQALYVLANPTVGQLTNAGFYWIPDLALPALASPGIQTPTLNGVPMEGTKWIGAAFQAQEWGILFAYMSLPILMLLTQLLVQKMSQPSKASGASQDPQARMMGQMMFFMPIMFAWITLGLPSGLTLYWTVSNLLALVQQYFVTGWGGLADWFPFLHAKQPAWSGATAGGAATTAASANTRSNATAARSNGTSVPSGKTASAGATSGGAPVTSGSVEETPEKPVKRKNRRRR